MRVLAILALCIPCMADPRLDALRDLLISMRGKPAAEDKVRGASPKLTAAKHQLRDWIESRMVDLDRTGQAGELEAQLNRQLDGAALTCADCLQESFLGFLLHIEFRRSNQFLVLVTGVGIVCGFDQSAYVYRWSDSHGWQRVWENEQNIYTEAAYKPQYIRVIQAVSQVDTKDFLVLTVGSQPWCSSTWHDIYYRVFRSGTAKPLLDGSNFAWTTDPIQGALSSDDATVEFSIASIDGGLHNRRAVFHFAIDQDKVKRIDPLALSPRDFVEGWIDNNHYKTGGYWESKDTMHCKTMPDLWQVQFSNRYFLVRWKPPYRFTMIQASTVANPKCTEPDPEADARRSLFPDH